MQSIRKSSVESRYKAVLIIFEQAREVSTQTMTNFSPAIKLLPPPIILEWKLFSRNKNNENLNKTIKHCVAGEGGERYVVEQMKKSFNI